MTSSSREIQFRVAHNRPCTPAARSASVIPLHKLYQPTSCSLRLLHEAGVTIRGTEPATLTLAMTHRVLTALALIAMAAMGTCTSGASVNILNAGFDHILVHCESKDSDLGALPVAPGANYSWEFSPNIFGMTLYTCEFFWKTFTQRFQVWKGSYYDTRPPCSVTGPCNYKVTPDGFYYGLQTYEDVTNASTAADQLWAFYQPWLPLNASQLFPH